MWIRKGDCWQWGTEVPDNLGLRRAFKRASLFLGSILLVVSASAVTPFAWSSTPTIAGQETSSSVEGIIPTERALRLPPQPGDSEELSDHSAKEMPTGLYIEPDSSGLTEIPAPQLKVSENQRFLQTIDGTPFFWLGDTAWELFHRLNREEVIHYLENRQRLGFTVVQAVALAELGGLDVPNAYGYLPLKDNDPAHPLVFDGPDNDYWDHVDFVVAEANRRGIVVGFLPTWGDKWNAQNGGGPQIFDKDNSYLYGKWLGDRYKESSLVWILGGDRDIADESHIEIMRAMAQGLREGDDGKHLQTWHPRGSSGSRKFFPDEPWIDFHMRQNGHHAEYDASYIHTSTDYAATPTKPIIDGEPLYEDHPIAFNAKRFGHSVASDVRPPLYWNLFTGAFGHTYGHHSVWQMWQEGRTPKNNPLMPWQEALHQPGAAQMQFAKKLLLARPYATRIPDQSILVESSIPSEVPGAGRYFFAATRDIDRTFAMVYVPVGRRFKVNMASIERGPIVATWFNPRNGSYEQIGVFPNEGEIEFISPTPGEAVDWVLVLDEAAQNYSRE